MSGGLEAIFLKAKRAEKRGDGGEARRLLEEVLARHPNNRKAHNELSRLRQPEQDPQTFLQAELAEIGKLHADADYEQMAIRSEKLARTFPQLSALQGVLGVAYLGLDNPALASTALRKAIESHPSDPVHHNNLGIALRQMGQLQEAEACYLEATRLNPDYAQAWYNLANLYAAQDRPDSAADAYGAALAIQPDYVDVHYNLGNLHRENRRYAQAMDCYERLTRLRPDHFDGWTNLASAQLAEGRTESAIASFRQAASIDPANGRAFINLANGLTLAGALNEAHEAFSRAHDILPSDHHVSAQLLYLEAHLCDWTRRDQFSALPIQAAKGNDPIPPFIALPFEDDPARLFARARIVAQAAMPNRSPAFAPPDRQPGGKIRIGYFSADFHDHATLHLMSGLLREHDRERFEIRAYSFGADDGSGRRQALLTCLDAFTDIREMSDAEVLERVRADALDIAVDLKGHTRDARLSLFAGRMAPVQIGYLGYPGTIGANFLDYIVADQVVIPAGAEVHYAEQVIRLPGSYQTNDDQRAIGYCPADRTELGLPRDGFVFCCFNQNWKIGPREFDIWMRLLKQVEGSVLWLIRSNPWAQVNLQEQARLRGVDPARLVFAEKIPHADHLARHIHADLFLDTFVVNAHTTASDALWGGLPMLTVAGEQFASRVGASLLSALDMPDLIASSPDHYEAMALELAHSPEKLAALKARLAVNRTSSPLFDTTAHTRSLEAAYEAAHERRLQGLAPAPITIGHDGMAFE
ncbi:tetratricopeptide repeat protein [Sphingobium sp. DC-2]|uniref:tetratricopeptide repeat protein n=1 Tax=Sphingobium sp. DC-2 TaxID=1303256 RepID=UPI00068B9E82|nr:tetratricopeptide repeat protein [Sphingobium sp. DC-2]